MTVTRRLLWVLLVLHVLFLVFLVKATGLGQIPTSLLDRVSLATAYVRTDQGLGSGIVFSEDGYLLTCAHVISGCTSVQVYLTDGKVLPARIVQSDPEIDTAILKIDAATPHYVTLGSSSSARYGDSVAAIGFPNSLFTVTTGTVSAFPRMGDLQILQITAPVNPGNSGGPLVHYSGEVIGIVFAGADAAEIFRRYDYIPQGINYAMPIDIIKNRFGLGSVNWRELLEAELVFDDDFNQPKAWWLREESEVHAFISDDLVLGPSYHYVSYREGWNVWTHLPGTPEVRNFILEVTARSASATPERVETWLVAFRSQSDANEYYRLRIYTDGSMELQRRAGGRVLSVYGRTYHDQIAQHRAANHVRLIVKGTDFTVEINGVEVARISDNFILGAGRVGIGVRTQDDFPYAHGVFTNVKLYRFP